MFLRTCQSIRSYSVRRVRYNLMMKKRGACRSTLVVPFALRSRRPQKACAQKSHAYNYSRRPRLAALFLCRDLGTRAVLTSRRNARRINSETVTSSRRALSRRSCWISRGSRNVTGTLPFGSFVLGMNHVYYCIIHIVNSEFSCPAIFAVTRSAA